MEKIGLVDRADEIEVIYLCVCAHLFWMYLLACASNVLGRGLSAVEERIINMSTSDGLHTFFIILPSEVFSLLLSSQLYINGH